MVGALEDSTERQLGRVVGQWLADPTNLLVISSDFCHWGERFRYTRGLTTSREDGVELWEWIEKLDQEALRIIQTKNGDAFRAYISETRNTICGRYPIGVFLRAVETVGRNEFEVYLTRYAQSSKSRSIRDSSVSYAAAQIYSSPP
mmetsp:Transcript_4201/g.9189  ORF Transcript_4201/g.9189 Transcript_4201/m.9189 type:complete len:146 (-) Transcript_4201:220-657(-)